MTPERRAAGARRRAGVRALIFLAVAGTSLVATVAPALAAPIVPGGPPVSVSIAAAGDTATLTFDATAGERVSLEITDVTIGTSVCCSTKVSILRPDNKVLASLTLGTNGGFIDAVTLPLAGTYSIVVDPQSTNVGDATLTLHAVPPDTISAIVLGGSAVTVGSTAPGQNATASFAGTAGDIVSVEISDITVGTSVCCSTKVSLIRPDGRTLATTTVGTNGGFLDAVALPLTGAYSIVVDPQGPLTGSATLVLHDVPADATVAGALGSTSTVGTTVPGQNARVTFAGVAGGRVSVEITDVTVGVSSCCTTKVTLLRPDGRVVSTTTVGTIGGFLDAATLTLTGTYTVVVDPQGAATGGVTLTLHDVPADASGSVVFGSSTAVTTTVPGQNAGVTFSGVAGQRASVVVSDVSFGTSTCCSLKVSMLRPNGTILVSPVTAGTNGGFLDAVVLPTTGTYTMVVDPQGPVTGSATFTLYDVPADAAGTIVPGGAPATVSTTVPGQNAGVTFNAVSNQKVSVKVGPGCCATRVSIIKPNGAVLVAAMTMSVGGGFIDTVTIPTTGTYTILVDLQGPATGDVTLTLYDVPADVTGTIAFGVPKTITTTVPGQNASLTFTGTAGQVVSLVMAGGCCTTRISLLKPNGTLLVSPGSFGAAGGFLDATTLPNNGTYTIAIDPQGAATGALTFTLHTVPSDVTGTLSYGVPAPFSTAVPAQNIRLTFAGTAGSRVSFRLDPSCCTTRISLLRPDGSVAASISSFGTSPAFLDPVSLTTSGTYTVLLDPQGSSLGSMTATVYDVPADITGAITFGTPVGVSLTVPGQNARLTFDGTAGQVVSAGLSNVTIGSSILSGTTVSIVKPDGNPLVSRNVGTMGGFLDAATLPVTGTYTVVVDPLGANTGGITVALEQVPVDVEASIAFGVPLTVTTTVSGQNARVSFPGTVGQRVSLQVSGNCCLSQISIREPDGSVLVAPATFGLGGGFIDTRTLAEAGTYSILIDPQGAATGSVTLTLHDVPADASGAIVANGAPVTTTTATPGQNSQLSFTGTAGQRVSLRIGSGCCVAAFSILDPGGAPVAGPTTFGSGGGFVDTVTLPSNGVYTVVADPQGVATGSLTLTLYDVPPDAVGSAVVGGPAVTVSTTTPGQNAALTFSGTAGDGLLVRIGPFNCCSTRVSVRNPDGSILAGPVSFNPDGGPLTTQLPTSGTYSLFLDPQGAAEGDLHVRLELDNTAPAPPLLSLSESALDSHVVGATFFYRPSGAGGTFTVGATTNDGGTGLDRMSFPGLSGGFSPTGLFDDRIVPYSQTYSWFPGSTFDNALNPVTAYDRVGNSSSTNFAVTSDAAPPATTDNTAAIGSGWRNSDAIVSLSPSDGTGSGSARTHYTADGSTPTTASPQGTSVTLSAEGVYTVKYFSIDNVGNVESPKTAGTQIRIDKTAPSSATLDPLPAVIKNGHILTGSGADALSGVGSIFYYFCAGASCTPATLIGSSSTGPGYAVTWSSQPADGTYQVLARVRDVAGNVLDSAKRTLTIDNTPPNTTITSAPAPATNSTSASFSFTATEASSFECSLDGAAFAACTSPRSYTGLAAGSHTFQVRATDTIGNTDPTPANHAWTVDLTAPETTITSAPANPSNVTGPSFSFSSSEGGSTFQCSLDGAAFAACTSPRSYTGLTAGSHTFQVRATDPAGNTDATPASHTWTVDLTAPDTTITSAPPAATNSTSASFSFTSTEAGSSFECKLDGAAFAACTSPRSYSSLADGSHTVQVRATDPAGNTDATPASHTWTVDTAPPNTTITSGPANPTNSTSASFSFTSTEAGSTFQCNLDGAGFGPCTSSQSYSALAAGSHTFQVRATDPVGNTDGTPASQTWTVDLTAPETTITSAPASPSNVTGPSFSFSSSEAGSTFQCSLDGAPFGACTSPRSYTGLTAGSHTFEVRATDPAGNTDPTPASHTWTIDVAAAETTITSGPANPTNSTSASFSFTSSEAGSTFQCSLDGAAFGACTTPQSYSGLAAGSHTFQVRATDPAGNTDATPASSTWTVDLTAPQTTITSAPASPSNVTGPSFSFTSSEAGSTFQCSLDGAAFGGCTSAQSYSGLAAGSHTFEVRATDPAGNTDATPASHTWVIDLTAPETTITAGPADPTNSTSASFSFTSSEAGSTFQCSLDGAAFGACTSPRSYSSLTAGSHTVDVRATDPAGNTDATPASRTWTIDLTAPETTITAGPSNPTNSTSASFSFASSETGSSFECRLDGAVFGACSSPASYSSLAAGSHTFEVRATDPAGNVDATPASHTWVVDLTAPETTITAGPPDPTNSTSASFSFTSSEAGSSFECKLDGAPFGACTSPRSYSGLSGGAHVFEVRATDPAGNTDTTPATFAWVVDEVPPETTITSAPPAATNSTSASFNFSSSEGGSTFQCSLDGAPYSACTSPQAYSSLSEGSHTFGVRAIDTAGNIDPTPATRSWVVDTTPPGTTIDAAPADPANATAASFSFSASEPVSTFECQLDVGGYSSCSSPQNYSGLAQGSHTFQVRAVDLAGNVDASAATYTWTIDTTAPNTTIGSAPAHPTNSTSANFSFTASEAGSTFQCSLDGGAFATCSSPAAYTGLSEAAHVFEVRATDPAGNTDQTPASRSWTVDTTAPTAPVIENPPEGSTSNTGNFTLSGSAEAGATVEIFEGLASRGTTTVSAGGSWAKALTGVADGSHMYTAHVTDAAGNTSAASNSRTVIVDMAAPNTTIGAGPVGSNASDAAIFSFSADEPAATFECSLDGASFTFCTSPKSYSGLSETSHTFRVQATDLAGNTDPTPASRTWTVDVTPPAAPVITAPADGSSVATSSVTFSGTAEPGIFVEIFKGTTSLGGTTANAGGSWSRTFLGVADGAHTYDATASDPAGNESVVSNTVTVTVDTTAPATTIDSAPASPTNATGASFSFSANEVGSSFECQLDGGGYSTCVSPQTYSGLTDGSHSFQVRAIDAVGHPDASPAAHSWTVDTAVPETTINAAPTDPSGSDSATFTFDADQVGSSFECSLDGAAFAPCSSPQAYSGLAEGSHTFEVQATDPAGNTDATSAASTWVVDLTAPETSITSGPADPTGETDAVFVFEADEAGATFECSLDGAAFTACSSPETYLGLGPGARLFETRAIDPAGNVDSTPASYGWTIS